MASQAFCFPRQRRSKAVGKKLKAAWIPAADQLAGRPFVGCLSAVKDLDDRLLFETAVRDVAVVTRHYEAV